MTTQREQFEVWAESKGITTERDGFGGYESWWTEGAFEGWQAAQAQAAPSQNDFATRGVLASSLKCWHRLTGAEAQELVSFMQAQAADRIPDVGNTMEPVAWLHKESQLMVHILDMAKSEHNEKRIKSGEFEPLYTAPQDYEKQCRDFAASEYKTRIEAQTTFDHMKTENERLSALCDKWNFECDEMREDNKRLAGLLQQAFDALDELVDIASVLEPTCLGDARAAENRLDRARDAVEAIRKVI